MAGYTVQYLSSGWEFKCETDQKWLSVSQIPSHVHTELMHHGLISDPFLNSNELESRWVAERTWYYRTTFKTPSEVTLNGKDILKSDNMFVEHRISITDILADDITENNLEIEFEPARRRGLDLVKAHSEHDFIVHQTEVSRGPVRKAQYHWGWDWGPILLTCGPWKPVRLETYVSRIEDIRVDYEVHTDDDGFATMLEAIVHARVIGPAAEIEVELAVPGSPYGAKPVVLLRDRKTNPDGVSPWRYSSDRVKWGNPQLWWPRGYGTQTFCDLQLRSIAGDGSTVLVEEYQKIGFRKVELIQENDQYGQSFYFRVNGEDIFAGGSCWIPADSFFPRVTPDRYRQWIEILAEGNQNMIRVWGGGVYEEDAFYTACDELGILVWQDFMFACASYPTYPEFLASVEVEARQNIRRLRHHPSVVLWCGNNEDYQLIERYDLEYNFASDKNPQSWLNSTFPARYIYEHLLPTILREESPSTHTIYHPGSPWGNGSSTTLNVDPTVGDIHQWDLWNGEAKPWQLLPQMGGRFVSEFGMVAYPHVDTIQRFVTDPAERYAGSRTLDFHNKAVMHERRLLAYIGENFRVEWARNLTAFAHLTQVLQADALGAGYKSWRRQWGRRKGGERRCGGVLVWQLNDCWPAVSWAVVDYYLVKKPAYYAIQRAMAPLAVGVARTFHDWTARPADELWRRNTGHVDPRRALTDVRFDVWVVSSRAEAVRGDVMVRFVSVKTGEEVGERMQEEVLVPPNGCVEVLTGRKFDWDKVSVAQPEPFVIHATLWVDGVLASSDTSWPDPIKYLDLSSDRGLVVKHVDQGLVEVSAAKPVKGFVFAERQGLNLSDNGFDLVPGDKPKLVWVEGGRGDTIELTWRFVGCP
ncbi:glycoside hydrolase family 2 protein [Parathielavia appendiculata]|uniref:beta-mannosidase n=1 Tax=Parathielavia appendiculata TaxID=2587402 RepID=A0AAN6TSU4_9PEZI|nr:glycoside hydrolase family 2 protein [Parathielavia appendiculata]